MRLEPTCWNLPLRRGPMLRPFHLPPPSRLHQSQHVRAEPLLLRNSLLFLPSFTSFALSIFSFCHSRLDLGLEK